MPPEGRNGITSDKCAELLYDHYKEGGKALAALLRVRLRLAVLTCLALALMVFQGTDPNSANSIFNALIIEASGTAKKDPALALRLDPRFISALLWFLLASLTTQTYSKSLVIEAKAIYLSLLEADLAVYFGPTILRQRENRARFLDRANGWYFLGSLFLMAVIVSLKVGLELKAARGAGVTTWVFTLWDLMVALVITYFTIFFVGDVRTLSKVRKPANQYVKKGKVQ
jgi:hypothetical protein